MADLLIGRNVLVNLIIHINTGVFKLIRLIIQLLKVPLWVRRFPYEADKAGLINLTKNTKGALHKPREMVFVLHDFRGKKATENAVFAIEQKGWKCTVIPQSGAPSKCVVESKKDDYCLIEVNYLNDIAFFNRIANLYHAEYDGWYAGGIPLMKERTIKWICYGVGISIFVIIMGIYVVINWQISTKILAPASTNYTTPTNPIMNRNPSNYDECEAQLQIQSKNIGQGDASAVEAYHRDAAACEKLQNQQNGKASILTAPVQP